jgi:hypothetical protein
LMQPQRHYFHDLVRTRERAVEDRLRPLLQRKDECLR